MQNMPPQNKSLASGLFGADYLEKWQALERLWWQSRSYSFVRKIYIRKGACIGERAVTRDHFFT